MPRPPGASTTSPRPTIGSPRRATRSTAPNPHSTSPPHRPPTPHGPAEAVTPLAHAARDQARQRPEAAEAEPRAPSRDPDEAPTAPRATAQRRARRPDELGSQVKETPKPLQDNAEPTAQEK